MPCLSAKVSLVHDGWYSQLTVKVDGPLHDVVAHDVSVSQVLGNDGGLGTSIIDSPLDNLKLTLGLSSWERGSVIPAPRGVEPVAPVGKTEALLGSASDADVTSRCAPSSYKGQSTLIKRGDTRETTDGSAVQHPASSATFCPPLHFRA